MNIIEVLQNEIEVMEDQIKEVRDSMKHAQAIVDKNAVSLLSLQRQRIELKETLDNYLEQFKTAVDKMQ